MISGIIATKIGTGKGPLQLEGMGFDLNYNITDLRKVRIRLAKDEARAIGYQLMAFNQI